MVSSTQSDTLLPNTYTIVLCMQQNYNQPSIDSCNSVDMLNNCMCICTSYRSMYLKLLCT